MGLTSLNDLEQSVLESIFSMNRDTYPELESHLTHLAVRSRENTGVGTYVYFGYKAANRLPKIANGESIVLSSSRHLSIDGLKYGLNYEVTISEGKFEFMELVTNGEDWDGKYSSFSLD